jgi:hypothetical protein
VVGNQSPSVELGTFENVASVQFAPFWPSVRNPFESAVGSSNEPSGCGAWDQNKSSSLLPPGVMSKPFARAVAMSA